jgi:DNA-binding protein HU-beta
VTAGDEERANDERGFHGDIIGLTEKWVRAFAHAGNTKSPRPLAVFCACPLALTKEQRFKRRRSNHNALKETPMTRTQFFTAVAEATGHKSKDVKAVFDSAFDVVMKQLPKDGKIPVGNLGFIKLVQRKARLGRNPATGEQIKIPAKTVVKFTVAAPIRAAFVKKKAKK